MIQEEISALQIDISNLKKRLENEKNAVMRSAYIQKIDESTARLEKLMQHKRRILLNSVWLKCVNCGESFHGFDFYRAYDEQAKKMHPAMSDEQRYKLVKHIMKEQGYWRKSASAIIENLETGALICPKCQHTYSLEELELMYHQNKFAISIAKVIVFFYRLTHKNKR